MPAASREPFRPKDFDIYRREYKSDAQYNGQRLEIRRRLSGWGKQAKARLKEAGFELDLRESIHNPHAFNHFSVIAQWVYLTRNAAQKRAFKKIFGDLIGKDVDSAYQNLYLSVAADQDGILVALRIHPEAWYDGTNLKNKVTKDRAALERLVERLRALPEGFELTVEGWSRRYAAAAASTDDLRQFFQYYTPGEHRLVLGKRYGRNDALTTSDALPEHAVDDLCALVDLYTFSLWSEENSYLGSFGS
ncbi:MAG: hypothetical protein H6834_11270 [Planctomycetes bacterium]|nr:hypothetical protein [Planctomycetota bacterium]